MTNPLVKGDIFQTRAQTVVLGLNATGRFDSSDLHVALQDRYPVFASEYRRRGRANLLTPGTVWVWREGKPWIAGMIVQETPQGAARLRFIEAAMLFLLKNWQQEQLASLALMRMGSEEEWQQAREVVQHYLSQIELPTIIYETYIPSIPAEDDQSPPNS